MSPLASQGAARSVEDVAVLGECLDKLSDPAALSSVLCTSVALRRPCVVRAAELARGNRIAPALPDSQEQESRDQRRQRSSSCENGVQEVLRPKPYMNQQWGQPGLMRWWYAIAAIEGHEKLYTLLATPCQPEAEISCLCWSLSIWSLGKGE